MLKKKACIRKKANILLLPQGRVGILSPLSQPFSDLAFHGIELLRSIMIDDAGLFHFPPVSLV